VAQQMMGEGAPAPVMPGLPGPQKEAPKEA
jgi:hypothetical protein